MVHVSVIVPTHNRCKYLRNAIISLQEQNFPRDDYEIIIVDNNSTDKTPEIVEECNKKREKEVIYIEEPKIGLHNARHAGTRVAKGKILAYVDDDVICDRSFLTEILKAYRDADVGCVGGRILPKWEIKPPDWINMFPKSYLSILDEDGEKREVQWVYGCNFSIRKKLLFELGGFNPDAFHEKKLWWMRGDGEIGLLKKVHDIGKKVIYNPKAIVWHVIPRNRLTISYFKERAFKSGVEASFSKYRYYDSGELNLLKLMMRFTAFVVYCIIHSVVAKSSIFLKNKSYYKYEVSSSYYKARCLYELRLTFDKKLQKFVKKKSWLE